MKGMNASKLILTACLGLGLYAVSPMGFSVPANAQKLTEAQRKQEVQKFLRALTTVRDQYERAKAATELGNLASPLALEQLHESLITDVSTQVRINSANAIAKINRKDSVPRLLKALKDNQGKTDVQLAIIRAVGDMRQNSRDPHVLKFLVKQMMLSPSGFVREASAEALWKIGDYQKTSRFVVRHLDKEEDLMVKITIVQHIADFKNADAIPILQRFINTPNEHVDVKALAQDALDKFEEMGIDIPPAPPPKK